VAALGQLRPGRPRRPRTARPGRTGQPAGLLHALVDLLRIDADLLTVAAQTSPVLATSTNTAQWRGRLADLSAQDEDEVLLKLLQDDPHVGADVRRRLTTPSPDPRSRERRRTVEVLLTAAQTLAAERQRPAAAQRAARRAAQKRSATAVRSRHLNALAAEGDDAWQRVDALIRVTKADAYEQAVAVLTDLREVAARQGHQADADHRVEQIRASYRNRPAFLQRLDRAGLRPSQDPASHP
jgi:hypothetical protein